MPVKASRVDQFKNHRMLEGTKAERLAYDMSNEDPRTRFYELDTGSTYEWTGIKWVGISLKGAKNIHDADVHNIVVNQYFHRHTGISTQTSVGVVRGSTTIPVVDSTNFSAGDYIQIANYSQVFPRVLSTAVGLLYIDRPLDTALTALTTIEQVSLDLNIVGSLASPVSFILYPHRVDHTFHIKSFILGMIHPAAGDDSRFGDIAALTNGCVLRGYNAEFDTFETFTNWKSNSDIRLDMFDLQYTDKAGGGAHGTNGNGEIHARTGAVPRLQPNDYLELLIQDDLTAITYMRLKGQGHLEGV